MWYTGYKNKYYLGIPTTNHELEPNGSNNDLFKEFSVFCPNLFFYDLFLIVIIVIKYKIYTTIVYKFYFPIINTFY